MFNHSIFRELNLIALLIFWLQMAGDEALMSKNYKRALELYHLSKVIQGILL